MEDMQQSFTCRGFAQSHSDEQCSQCGYVNDLTRPFEIGTILENRYRIDKWDVGWALCTGARSDSQ